MKRAARQAVLTLTVAALAAALSACNRGQGGTTGSKDTAVAAAVNGRNIMLSEVDNLLKQQARAQQAQFESMSPLELAAGRLQVLNGLIQQEVLFQRAEREKVLPSEEEITQVINEQKQQGGLTAETYQRMLKESGQTEQSVRELARKQLAIQKLMDRVSAKIDAPSDKEVEDFYNNNRARYVVGRGVQLAAIIVDPQDNGATNDAKGDTEAQNKINIIHQRLKSGADFASVAREQSEDPQTTARGGDIGFFTEEDLKRSGFPQDLAARFFTMETGDITAPVKGSDNRWSIFKLTEKRLQSENLTLDDPRVRKDAADAILNQRKQIMNAALIEVAMREAKVTNNLAQDMLNSSSSLSSLRPAGSTPTPMPAAAANPSPAADAGGAAKADAADANTK